MRSSRGRLILSGEIHNEDGQGTNCHRTEASVGTGMSVGCVSGDRETGSTPDLRNLGLKSSGTLPTLNLKN